MKKLLHKNRQNLVKLVFMPSIFPSNFTMVTSVGNYIYTIKEINVIMYLSPQFEWMLDCHFKHLIPAPSQRFRALASIINFHCQSQNIIHEF